MAESIKVGSIQSLTDLRNTILGFSHNVSTAIQAAEADIRQIQEHIHESEQRCQRAVQAAQRDLQEAQFALIQCQNSGYTDCNGYRVQPDCTPYAHAVAEAQRRLRAAREALGQVQYWKGQVAHAEQSYRAQVRKMRQLVEGDTDRARLFLDSKVAELEAYVGLTVSMYQAAQAAASTVGGMGAETTAESASHSAQSNRESVTWAESQAVLKKIDNGEAITHEELEMLRLPISDMRTEILQENRAWVQEMIEGERFYEITRDLWRIAS